MKGKTILVVDDEPGIRGVLRIFLELDEFRVLEAAAAEEAVEIVNREKPDLVILDVILGGTTGFEACRRIKSNPETKSVAVCLFTALGRDQDIQTGKEAGADLYIPKPLSPKDIVRRITDFLQARG